MPQAALAGEKVAEHPDVRQMQKKTAESNYKLSECHLALKSQGKATNPL